MSYKNYSDQWCYVFTHFLETLPSNTAQLVVLLWRSAYGFFSVNNIYNCADSAVIIYVKILMQHIALFDHAWADIKFFVWLRAFFAHYFYSSKLELADGYSLQALLVKFSYQSFAFIHELVNLLKRYDYDLFGSDTGYLHAHSTQTLLLKIIYPHLVSACVSIMKQPDNWFFLKFDMWYNFFILTISYILKTLNFSFWQLASYMDFIIWLIAVATYWVELLKYEIFSLVYDILVLAPNTRSHAYGHLFNFKPLKECPITAIWSFITKIFEIVSETVSVVSYNAHLLHMKIILFERGSYSPAKIVSTEAGGHLFDLTPFTGCPVTAFINFIVKFYWTVSNVLYIYRLLYIDIILLPHRIPVSNLVYSLDNWQSWILLYGLRLPLFVFDFSPNTLEIISNTKTNTGGVSGENTPHFAKNLFKEIFSFYFKFYTGAYAQEYNAITKFGFIPRLSENSYFQLFIHINMIMCYNYGILWGFLVLLIVGADWLSTTSYYQQLLISSEFATSDLYEDDLELGNTEDFFGIALFTAFIAFCAVDPLHMLLHTNYQYYYAYFIIPLYILIYSLAFSYLTDMGMNVLVLFRGLTRTTSVIEQTLRDGLLVIFYFTRFFVQNMRLVIIFYILFEFMYIFHDTDSIFELTAENLEFNLFYSNYIEFLEFAILVSTKYLSMAVVFLHTVNTFCGQVYLFYYFIIEFPRQLYLVMEEGQFETYFSKKQTPNRESNRF